PDGRLLATAGLRNVIGWDVATGKRLHTFPFLGNEGTSTPPASMAFSPTSRFLAVSRNTDRVKIWDLGSGKEAFDHIAFASMYLACRFGSSDDRLETMIIDFAGGRQKIVFESWDVALDKQRSRFNCEPNTLGSRNWRGRFGIHHHYDSSVLALVEWGKEGQANIASKHRKNWYRSAVSPDGSAVACIDDEGRIDIH